MLPRHSAKLSKVRQEGPVCEDPGEGSHDRDRVRRRKFKSRREGDEEQRNREVSSEFVSIINDSLYNPGPAGYNTQHAHSMVTH